MLLWIASVSALIIALIHTFAGGPQLLPPLLENQKIPDPIKLVHYYCWHIVTMVLFAISAAYAYAAVEPSGRILAVIATWFCFLCFLWGIFLVTWKKQKHSEMPQWILFIIQFAIGAYTIWG